MEPVGVSANETPKQSNKSETGKSKVWFFVLCGLFVVIVGLVIAIVVVKNLPREEITVSTVDSNLANSAYNTYEAVREQIMSDILSDELSDSEILELYKIHIRESQDELVKAYLMSDYYEEVMAQDIELSKGDEVIDGLTDVDKVLNSAASSRAVWAAAEYYGNKNIANQYKDISEKRLNNGVNLEYIE